jgi:hypothetical protein
MNPKSFHNSHDEKIMMWLRIIKFLPVQCSAVLVSIYEKLIFVSQFNSSLHSTVNEINSCVHLRNVNVIK